MRPCVVHGCITRPEYVWVTSYLGEVRLCVRHLYLAEPPLVRVRQASRH